MACAVQRRCPETLVVSVADREGDIHEWFLDAAERDEEERAAFVIRAKCNRRIAAQPQDTYLWEALKAAPVLGQTTIEVVAQAKRAARQACLTVRALAVTFNRGRRRGGHLPPVRVHAVYVKEEGPPLGEEQQFWVRGKRRREGRARAPASDRSRKPRLVWLGAGGGKCRRRPNARTVAWQETHVRAHRLAERWRGSEILRVISDDGVPLGTRIRVVQIDV
jgi:hypothetical protein